TLDAEGLADSGRCPTCGGTAEAVHDRYRRAPHDLPWRGSVVRLVVTVRRFRCPNLRCPRATFAEGFGVALPGRARRTADAAALLLHFARVAGGEGGARLAGA